MTALRASARYAERIVFCMAKGVIVPQEKRDEIIAKIRDEGMTVAEAARQYSIGPKAIYSWMRDGVARFAIALSWTEKKARRIRNLADVTAAKRTKKRRGGKRIPGEVAAPANALKPYADFKDELRPQDGQSYARMVESGAWVQDFTHL
jgi:hypothetical protein